MDMHSGNGPLDGAQKVTVEETVKVARQTTLNAHFRCAAVPRFLSAANDLLKRKRVSIGGLRAAAKSAKTASDKTNVGEINIAAYDVGDAFSNGLASQMIRGGYQCVQLRPLCAGQTQTLVEGKRPPAQDSFQRIARIGCAT